MKHECLIAKISCQQLVKFAENDIQREACLCPWQTKCEHCLAVSLFLLAKNFFLFLFLLLDGLLHNMCMQIFCELHSTLHVYFCKPCRGQQKYEQKGVKHEQKYEQKSVND